MPTRDPASTTQVLPLLNPDEHAASAAPTALIIDTIGFRYATIILSMGDLGGAVTTSKMEQDTAVGFGSATDVTSAVFVIAGTEDNTVQIGQIDTHNTERFLRLSFTNGASANDVGAVIILSANADTSVYSATSTIFSV